MRLVSTLRLLAVLPLAMAAGSVHAQSADPILEAVTKDIAARFAKGGRYMIGIENAASPHQHCRRIGPGDPLLPNALVAPYADFAEHPDAKLLECDYPIKSSTRRGWVIVLAASAANIASRLIGACKAVAPSGVAACVEGLIGKVKPNGKIDGGEAVWGSNNLQFPITGFVEEGAGPCATNNKPGLIGFRHGVTIRYGKSETDPTDLGFCFTTKVEIARQRTIGLNFRTHRVRNVGRLAALPRSNLPTAEHPPNFEIIEPPGLEPDAWQRFVQVNEIRAIKTGQDRLMVLRAAQIMSVAAPPP